MNDISALSNIFYQPHAITVPIIKRVEARNDIWDDEDLVDLSQFEDRREIPEYTLNYRFIFIQRLIERQSVASEDIFLGLSGKSHSIMDADELCIKIILPHTNSINDITLNPHDQILDVRTKSQ